MHTRLFAAVALAAALVPAMAGAASAETRRHAGTAAPEAVADHESGGNFLTAVLTRLIVPEARDPRRPPVAYADNPDLIGNRRGSTNAMFW